MNQTNEIYWEKERKPEFPVFKEVKEARGEWDDVKKVYNVEDKYQRFYGGIVGNDVADKERKSESKAQKNKAEDAEDENDYFNELRGKLKEQTGSGSEGGTPKKKGSDKEAGFDSKKRRNSATLSDQGGSPVNKPTSHGGSPRNFNGSNSGAAFSKFKNP